MQHQTIIDDDVTEAGVEEVRRRAAPIIDAEDWKVVAEAETAALFDALSYAAQCTERRKRERQLQLLRAI